MKRASAILKAIGRELRLQRTHEKVISLDKNPTYKYIVTQYAKFQPTTEQESRHVYQLEHFAQSYLSYLQSLRRKQELINRYAGKRELSVEEAAHNVGLTVPPITHNE